MEKTFNKRYFNTRNYILDNISSLKLSPKEAIIILLIDLNNEFNQVSTDKTLSEASGIDINEVNDIILGLCNKRYIEIITKRGVTKFSIEPLFIKKEVTNIENISDIFDIFSSEFQRPLSQSETIKLGEWVRKYSFEQLTEALKNASIYKKMSFSYIEKILSTQ